MLRLIVRPAPLCIAAFVASIACSDTSCKETLSCNSESSDTTTEPMLDSGSAEPDLAGDAGDDSDVPGIIGPPTRRDAGAGFACGSSPDAPEPVLDSVAAEVQALLEGLTIDEKIELLNGGAVCPAYDCDFVVDGNPTHGIGDLVVGNGTRGAGYIGGSAPATVFPVPIARAASFDVDLEHRVGDAIGREARLLKEDLLMGPMLGVLWHPAWGRAQETYGEDPVLIGTLGGAFLEAVQNHVPACVQGIGVPGRETGRPAEFTELQPGSDALVRTFLRPLGLVMERVEPACLALLGNNPGDGETANGSFVRSLFDWNGFITADFWSTGNFAGSTWFNSGLDLELPDESAFQSLPQDVEDQLVDEADIDAALARILNVRQRFGQLSSEYLEEAPAVEVSGNQTRRALALEAAEKSAVLLYNDGILPLLPEGADDAGIILVAGPDSDLPRSLGVMEPRDTPDGLGHAGLNDAREPYAISVAEGLEAELEGTDWVVRSSLDPSAMELQEADVVIVPIAMGHADEGEWFGGGADRQEFGLENIHPQHWPESPAGWLVPIFIENPNLVLIVMSGTANDVAVPRDSSRAIVHASYLGQEGGAALAKLLLGRTNFTGKLPFTVLSALGNYPPIATPGETSDVGDVYGYQWALDEGLSPQYWFGYGLSYTSYEYANLSLCAREFVADETLTLQVDVTNVGAMDGEEVVQVFVDREDPSGEPPLRRLVAFARVSVDVDQTQSVAINVPLSRLAETVGNGAAPAEPGIYTVIVAASADPDLDETRRLTASFSILSE
jgi:beta-glucosidase